MVSLGKAAIATPVYISFAWTLMISYQIFTETAVSTIMTYINMFSPSIGTWLSTRVDTIIFIYAFAWIFVLSSVIPSVILGKGRSVLVQFIVCLTLTFMAFMIQDVLAGYAARPVAEAFSLNALLENPILAVTYLLMPYILMITLDIRSRKKPKQIETEDTRKTEEMDDPNKTEEPSKTEETNDPGPAPYPQPAPTQGPVPAEQPSTEEQKEQSASEQPIIVT